MELGGKADAMGFGGGVFRRWDRTVKLLENRRGGGCCGGRRGGSSGGGGSALSGFFDLVFIFNGDFDLAGFSSQHLLRNLQPQLSHNNSPLLYLNLDST
ncbi:hypothetical protein SAY87_017369 [Trapa incisa]|uniref:Uncharacterized protein n=1 Tax=Trapa incisa TaxID=236973 RepID=A0AAN7QZY7_9MYRT|nr:hypothetical protein SAY87_017369 [Trapa incisa]